jgi:leucine dehydrogenase
MLRASVGEFSWHDANSGLEAVMVVDDTTLGPPVGGTRTKSYATFAAARADAQALARAMTLKCALAGLNAGGMKIVVRAPPNLRGDARRRVFDALGRQIAALSFPLHTAGDFGTNAADLQAMARHAPSVHLGGDLLVAATARGLLRCVEVCAGRRGARMDALSVAVQGCGAIGASVAAALVHAGARVTVADIDRARAEILRDAFGCRIAEPHEVLELDVDVVAPCAVGGVIDHHAVPRLNAWAIVGAANNVIAHRSVAAALRDRAIVFVPDVIASAGAVIDGVGALVMGIEDRNPWIDRLAIVLEQTLDYADREGVTTLEAAEHIASQRLGTVKRLLLS